VMTRGEQRAREVPADEAGGAGQDDAHRSLTPLS
jgi:hypothetical protein